jgi:chaperonin cofactor prefoldin
MAHLPAKKTVESRLTAVERGIKSLQANDSAILSQMREGFAQIESQFARMEGRLDEIYNHIDGFMKLHETLDIEFKVMKEQMKRLEERVERLEAS